MVDEKNYSNYRKKYRSSFFIQMRIIHNQSTTTRPYASTEAWDFSFETWKSNSKELTNLINYFDYFFRKNYRISVFEFLRYRTEQDVLFVEISITHFTPFTPNMATWSNFWEPMIFWRRKEKTHMYVRDTEIALKIFLIKNLIFMGSKDVKHKECT